MGVGRVVSLTLETRERLEIETEEGISLYYRYEPGVWFVQMGMSDEPLMDSEWVEALYQEYRKGRVA